MFQNYVADSLNSFPVESLLCSRDIVCVGNSSTHLPIHIFSGPLCDSARLSFVVESDIESEFEAFRMTSVGACVVPSSISSSNFILSFEGSFFGDTDCNVSFGLRRYYSDSVPSSDDIIYYNFGDINDGVFFGNTVDSSSTFRIVSDTLSFDDSNRVIFVPLICFSSTSDLFSIKGVCNINFRIHNQDLNVFNPMK